MNSQIHRMFNITMVVNLQIVSNVKNSVLILVVFFDSGDLSYQLSL